MNSHLICIAIRMSKQRYEFITDSDSEPVELTDMQLTKKVISKTNEV